MSFHCTCPGLGVSPDCLAHMYDPTEDEPVCNCYPNGFSPGTYEGPQHHCVVHGHGNDLHPKDCPDCVAACWVSQSMEREGEA